MVFCNSPNIFQEIISKLFKGFDMVFAYIDYVLLITKNAFKDYLKYLGRVLHKIAEEWLKINAEESFFGQTKTEYISFWVRKIG